MGGNLEDNEKHKDQGGNHREIREKHKIKEET